MARSKYSLTGSILFVLLTFDLIRIIVKEFYAK